MSPLPHVVAQIFKPPYSTHNSETAISTIKEIVPTFDHMADTENEHEENEPPWGSNIAAALDEDAHDVDEHIVHMYWFIHHTNWRFMDIYTLRRLVRLLQKIAKYLYEHDGDFRAEMGVGFAKRNLEFSNSAYGIFSSSSLLSQIQLATFYTRLGQYEEAESQYLKALWISETAFGLNHPKTAAVLNNLSVVYDRQGRFKEAKRTQELALETNTTFLTSMINCLKSLYECL